MAYYLKDTFFWAGWTFFWAFVCFFAVELSVELPTGYTTEAGLSPQTWPRAVAFLFFFFSLLQGIVSFISHWRLKSVVPEQADAMVFDWKKLICAVMALVVYYLAIFIMGMTLASFVMFIFFTQLCGARNLKKTIPIGLGLSISLYAFFYFVAKIPLPPGPFGGMI